MYRIGSSLLVLVACKAAVPTTKIVPIPLANVSLLPGSHQFLAQATNVEYLCLLSADSLLWNFRSLAGLDTSGTKPYDIPGSWINPTAPNRGFFTGHYLSATAMAWAATKNATLRQKSMYLVAELRKCQLALKTGYLGAFPDSFFDDLEYHQNATGVPYYNLHKLMAGLIDQYHFSGSELALTIVSGMADYFVHRMDNFKATAGVAQWQRVLDTEFGGFNEMMYNLYAITREARYVELGNWFNKEKFINPLAARVDMLTGLHANTHLAQLVGAARRAEVLGDELYSNVTSYCFDLLNSTRAYVTYGTSWHEGWNAPMSQGKALSKDGLSTEETCTQYNILKVARKRFQWSGDVRFADWYERGLVNGILGTQKTGMPGEMLYMLPLGVGVSKGWGQPFGSFWCCYGTGIENNAKLGDTIYHMTSNEEDDVSLFVLQYVSSTVHWGSMLLEQHSQFPEGDCTTLTVKDAGPEVEVADSVRTIAIRIPGWVSPEDASVLVNGKEMLTKPVAAPFWLRLRRPWGSGDTIQATFVQRLRLEQIKDTSTEYRSWYAVLFGPTMLVGLMPPGTMSNAISPVDVQHPERWIQRVNSSSEITAHRGADGATTSLTFVAVSMDNTMRVVLRPLNQIRDERYTAYFALDGSPSLCSEPPFCAPDGTQPSAQAADLVLAEWV